MLLNIIKIFFSISESFISDFPKVLYFYFFEIAFSNQNDILHLLKQKNRLVQQNKAKQCEKPNSYRFLI